MGKVDFVIEHILVDESKVKKDQENSDGNKFRKKYGGDGPGISYWLTQELKKIEVLIVNPAIILVAPPVKKKLLILLKR